MTTIILSSSEDYNNWNFFITYTYNIYINYAMVVIKVVVIYFYLVKFTLLVKQLYATK